MNDLQRVFIGLLVFIFSFGLFVWGNWDNIPRWWHETVSADWGAILGLLGGIASVFTLAYVGAAWQDHKLSKKGKQPWEK